MRTPTTAEKRQVLCTLQLMLRLSLIFLILAWSNLLFAQTDSVYIRNQYSRSDGPIVFLNGINLITVKTANADRIKLTNSPGTDILDFQVNHDTIQLRLYAHSNHQHFLLLTDTVFGRVVKKIDFEVQEVSAPFAQVGNIQTSVVSKNILLSQPGLLVSNTNNNYKYKFVVTNYILKTAFSGTTYKVNTIGPYFTKEIKDILTKLPYNTTIEFTDIRATCPDCRNRAFPSIKLLVK